MSAIVEAKTGYGWTLSGGTLSSITHANENGYFYTISSNSKSISLVKTIKVDKNRINPTYIFYQVRLYSDLINGGALSTVKVSVYGLTCGDYTTESIAISDGGNILLTVEGYTTESEVNIAIISGTVGSPGVSVYPMNET